MIKSPLKAIRAYCIDCSGGQPKEVKLCVCTDCPLYAFRFGKSPYSTRKLSDEQRQALSERATKMRESLMKTKH